MPTQLKKLKLHGFNNLTKTLSFNIYDICYAESRESKDAYIKYIDETYCSQRLTGILSDVVEIIGASILNIARQDFDPQGSSVTMLIAEEPLIPSQLSTVQAPGPLPEAIAAHLDKSHITVHTYPESHPEQGVCSFRVDIDVATCGLISPLNALNYLIHSFDSDILTLDYRVRGFTRDVAGRKHFIDHDISSIRNYLSSDTIERYLMEEVNLRHENIFHTRMMLREFALEDYLFCAGDCDLSGKERRQVKKLLRREMAEIFHGRNLGRFLEPTASKPTWSSPSS